VASETLAEGRRLSQLRARQTLPPAVAPDSPAPGDGAPDSSAPDLPAPDEAALARRFAAGDVAAFEEVVALYQHRVTRLANRLLGWGGARDAHDVDDAVQDVFLAALSNARRCRGGASGMWPWLATITVNTCRSIRRRAWVRLRFVRDLLSRPAVEGVAADDDGLEADERLQAVRDAVSRLPGKDREVIVLHYLEGMRPADIADVLGASTNAVEVRLHRARAKLKVELALDEESHGER
jgi:RNA polymerase sigma-70 factor (ECF subfamily)